MHKRSYSRYDQEYTDRLEVNHKYLMLYALSLAMPTGNRIIP